MHPDVQDFRIGPDFEAEFVFQAELLQVNVFLQPVDLVPQGDRLVAVADRVAQDRGQRADRVADIVFVLFNGDPVDGVKDIIDEVYIIWERRKR